LRQNKFAAKKRQLDRALKLAHELKETPNILAQKGFKVNQDGVRRSAIDMLGYPHVTVHRLLPLWPDLGDFSPDIIEQLEIAGCYAGYMERQATDIRAFRSDESLKLPDDLDYANIGGLSTEIVSKLIETKPATLGQAARISGVTPAALTALLGYVRRVARQDATDASSSAA
jgi:tRNA uridine 5-carboxymethylaminomethyl modification enzyme